MDDNEPTHNKQRDPASSRLLGGSDIAAIIAAMKADQPSSSTQTAVPSFARKGYASQYEFNVSLMQNLSRISKKDLRKEDEEILEATVSLIKVRNETLKIADKHPGVFPFIDNKKQAEAIKSSDIFLSEFLEKVQKEGEKSKKKRTSSPGSAGQPFGGRESAWRPDSRISGYAPRYKSYQQPMERYGYRRNFTPRTPYQKYRKDKPDRPRSPVFCADTKDIGGTNVQTGNGEYYPGSIHDHISMWTTLEPNALVLDTIVNGYTIPFDEAPEPPPRVGNRKSARDNAEFVDSNISELMASGAIERVPRNLSSDLMIHPLSVAEGKKLRLVLDLSSLNRYVTKEHVKFDDMEKVRHLLPRGGFMTSFDLRKGYHHIRIAERSQQFLGFEWDGNIYRFTVLPFGLSSAPHIFTKMLRRLVKKWRGEGKGVAIYLDDGLIWAPSRSECERVSNGIKNELKRFGLFEAEEKSNWIPRNQTKWLGFNID
nr:RNA-directed DNA polymerase (reverse transcriptase) domain containing protein [Haemonchus contortus]